MPVIKRPYREILIEQVKLLGKDVVDQAENIVGDGELITGLDVNLHFPVPSDGFPEITISRSHASKNYIKALRNRED